ncbi:serine/threonine-protein kinase M1 [Podila humilis]|nr:serine/threonine-protein kinase M1 [Podila humilis]
MESLTAEEVRNVIEQCCENQSKGVGPVLNAYLNGTQAIPDTLRMISEYLHTMAEMVKTEAAGKAFALQDRHGKTATTTITVDQQPIQRLEWLMFTSITPVLAVPALATSCSDLVLGLLQSTYTTLGSPEDSELYNSTLLISRAVDFRQAVLRTVEEIMKHLETDPSYPHDFPIQMSVFRTGTSNHSHESDPVWMSFRFSSLSDPINVLWRLITFLSPTHDETGWPRIKTDDNDNLKVSLVSVLTSVFKLVQSSQPKSLNSVSTALIDQLYQACGHCILQIIPRLGYRIKRELVALGLRLALALHQHVSTMQERYTATREGLWKEQQQPSQQPSSLKDHRKESVTRLESFLVKGLMAVMEQLLATPDSNVDLFEIFDVVSSLLISDELMEIGVDESGQNIQIAIICISVNVAEAGRILNPLQAIDYVLKHYSHLESRYLVRFVYCCLQYWQANGESELKSDMELDDSLPVAAILPLENVRGDVGSSTKRSYNNMERDRGVELANLPEKRTRIEPHILSPSAESSNSSTILSQFSQKTSQLLPVNANLSSTTFSITEQLILFLRRYIDVLPVQPIPSQGPRGVPPSLSKKDLQCILVLTQVWMEFEPDVESNDSVDDVGQFELLMVSLFKSYLDWTLTPGMQDPSLNQEYLRSSYPLILDLAAVVAQTRFNRSLVEYLVCITSGPWFPTLKKRELWWTSSSTDIMVDDDRAGIQQLVQLILYKTQESEIHSRLRATPETILAPYTGFHNEKQKALRIMASLPHLDKARLWRRDVTLAALNPSLAPLLFHGEAPPIKAVALECIALMASHCPDMRRAAEKAVGLALMNPGDGHLMKTLALRMASMFCGLSRTSEVGGIAAATAASAGRYDIHLERIVPVHKCALCSLKCEDDSAVGYNTMDHDQAVDVSFLEAFNRLIPLLSPSESGRVILLKSLYRVFCHLRLESVNLKGFAYGQFVLEQLSEKSEVIQSLAGKVVEVVAVKAGWEIQSDPLGPTSMDNNLRDIGDAIVKILSERSNTRELRPVLSLCRAIMMRLTEDHLLYLQLLEELIVRLSSVEQPKRTLILHTMSLIAQDKGLTIYRMLEPKLELVCTAFLETLNGSSSTWLLELCGWANMTQGAFIGRNLPLLIPKTLLVQQEPILDKLSAIVSVPTTRMCIQLVDHILAAIFMEETPEEFERSITFFMNVLRQGGQESGIKTEAVDLPTLTTVSLQSLLWHLSVELGHEHETRQKRAMEVIKMVDSHAWEKEVSELRMQGKTPGARRSLSTFLCRHFLGIMSDVNNAMQSSATLTMKARYLRSLAPLTHLLEPVPRSFVPKILSPLITALDKRGLRRISLQVLEAVVRRVGPKNLESSLPVVVHALTKVYPNCTPSDQDSAHDILQILLVEYQEFLADVLPTVGALPELPKFRLMNRIVAASKSSLDSERQMAFLLERTAHDNDELAAQALLELRDALLSRESQLLKVMTTRSSGVTTEIVPIIQALMDGVGRYRGLDATVPRLCVECLGIVGAVDPALITLQRKPMAVPLLSNFDESEEAKHFVCMLIEHRLVKPAQSLGDFNAESQWALALQSLLSFCGISKDVLVEPTESSQIGRQSLSQRPGIYSQTHASSQMSSQLTARRTRLSARQRWNLFPRNVQDMLELYIDAKYNKKGSMAKTDYARPHYNHTSTFKDWLTRWTLELISQVKEDNAVKIFQACERIIMYDTNICLYILPHLVMSVLRDGSLHEQKAIIDEMATVLADGYPLPQHQQQKQQQRQKQKQQQQLNNEKHQHQHQQQQDNETDLLTGSTLRTSERYELGCQAVFTVFDHISKWIQMRKNASHKHQHQQPSRANFSSVSMANRAPNDDALLKMQTHLTAISHSIIAMASLRCRAYARALQHYEQYIRNARRDGRIKEDDDGDSGLQECFVKLQEIYVHMDDADGMRGLSTRIDSGSHAQQLLQNESAGRWREAMSYYDLPNEPVTAETLIGAYRCLDNLGDYGTLLSAAEGDIMLHPDWEQELSEWRIGAAWKQESWDTLEEALARPALPSFETRVGQMLLDVGNNRTEAFTLHLEECRSSLIAPLAASSMESYARSYDQVAQLHVLRELEVASNCWKAVSGESSSLTIQQPPLPAPGEYVVMLQSLETALAQRLEIMAPSFRVREQVNRIRRIAFYNLRLPSLDHGPSATFLKEECGKSWMQSSQAARKSGNEEVAFRALLQSELSGYQPALIERVKWGLRHNQEREALQSIEVALKQLPTSGSSIGTKTVYGRAIERSTKEGKSHRFPALARSDDIDCQLRPVQDRVLNMFSTRFLRAKALMLRTRWKDKSNSVSPTEIVDGYREAINECPEWEKGYYLLGQHFFKLFESSRRLARARNVPGFVNYEYATRGFDLFGKALTLGPKYLYQILPRLLTIWLDFGVDITKPSRSGGGGGGSSSSSNSVSQSLAREFSAITNIMDQLCEKLPPYMLLSAFPQIISRMCHKNTDAFSVLRKMISTVVMAFPDQAIWQMVSVSKSTVPIRKNTCKAILEGIMTEPTVGVAIGGRIKATLDLCDQLIQLCMHPVHDKVPKLSMEKVFPKIVRWLKTPSNVTIPFHLSLWPTLPESSRTMASHQSFPTALPKIDNFMDEIEIMSSLQKPRKVTIEGSDGCRYTFLCKPKDDLRKDAKVMELNFLVNRLLQKNREAHKRNLYIRTYAVVPLNEECGLIEWVYNTVPYRHIMQRQYKLHSITTMPIPDIKRVLDSENNVRLFVHELLPKFPPIFYQWFKEIAPEPTEWFAARQRYTRTTAVMSMVGHIMGLGDRHGENLLFDERNGDIVHVDFNCLFEQGKTFPKPERVPFRLTHNMVDAMGLSGYEGVYRIACEITLRVFRDNIESLTSVLEGFIHDPLVEWSKVKKRNQHHHHQNLMLNNNEPNNNLGGDDFLNKGLGEVVDSAQTEKATSTYNTIRRKLLGSELNGGHQLSVEGQVQELINVAISPDNLAHMYIGWSAYM